MPPSTATSIHAGELQWPTARESPLVALSSAKLACPLLVCLLGRSVVGLPERAGAAAQQEDASMRDEPGRRSWWRRRRRMWLVASVVVGAAARRRVVGELLPSRRVPLPLAAASHLLLRCYVHEGAWWPAAGVRAASCCYFAA